MENICFRDNIKTLDKGLKMGSKIMGKMGVRTSKMGMFKKFRFKKSRLFLSSKGLSLIEMLVVVGILAFIMSIVARNVTQGKKKSQVSQAKILIGLIEQAMEEFSYDCGYYPESLEDLVEPPPDCEEWGPQPYLKNGKIPKDPWGQDFHYEYDEESGNYAIISFGADRKPGGSGRFNKDISSLD